MQPLKEVTTLVFLDIITFRQPPVTSHSCAPKCQTLLCCLNKAVRNIYIKVTYINDQKPLF